MARDLRILDFVKSTDDNDMNSQEIVDFYTDLWSKYEFNFRYLAKKALKLKPDAIDIADIGTGPGFLAIQLARLSGKKIKAVDLAPNMLNKANKLAAKAGVQIQTIEADCRNLPFKDASLDLVTSSALIHMLEDSLPFFIELKRVVKPGGKALIAGFRRDPRTIVRKLADFHTNVMYKNKPLNGLGAVLNASFTKEELESLLDKAELTSHHIKKGVMTLTIIINF